MVRVLHVPFLPPVNGIFNPINPFSGIYTGTFLPKIPAILSAAHKNNSDLPREVFSLHFKPPSFSLIGALEFAVKLINLTDCSG